MKEARAKTISKNFYDDEIIGRDSNGDLILQMGVKRKNYTLADGDLNAMEQINYQALAHDTLSTKIKSYNDIDDNGSEVDNWE